MRRMQSCIALAFVVVLAQANTYAREATVSVASDDTAADSDQTIGDFLDLNDDHRISYDEFVHSMAVKAIREMDADRDGTLSPAEVATSSAKGHADVPPIDFSKADSNGDGQLSLDELKQAIDVAVRAHFPKLDKNGDGFLDESEVRSIHEVPLIRFHF
jgi:Ca2+-binding EF-hand superfamily protein